MVMKVHFPFLKPQFVVELGVFDILSCLMYMISTGDMMLAINTQRRVYEATSTFSNYEDSDILEDPAGLSTDRAHGLTHR